MIGILVAEHRPVVRRGLVASLEGEAGLKVVAEVDTGEAVLPAVLEHRPETAVVDLDLPGADGFAVALGLHERVRGHLMEMIDNGR
ncbi:response regulator transcription factor [Streptosporangium algeriense]|uniref:Response regulator transcription factor n=1 Tax=Streptosporangium algeriense TaxID=1682748 RepID=A0ABW3DRH4_9ACTN